MITKRIQEMLDNPCTPFWVKDVIKTALDKDCLDSCLWLGAVSAAFEARADEIVKGIAS